MTSENPGRSQGQGKEKPAGSSIQRGWHILAFPRWAFPVSRERQREGQTLLLMSGNIPCTLFKQSRNKECEGNRDGQSQKQGERTRGCVMETDSSKGTKRKNKPGERERERCVLRDVRVELCCSWQRGAGAMEPEASRRHLKERSGAATHSGVHSQHMAFI